MLERHLNEEPLAYHGGGQAPKLPHSEVSPVKFDVWGKHLGLGLEREATVIVRRIYLMGNYDRQSSDLTRLRRRRYKR